MQVGLEIFLSKEYKKFKKFRLGVVCNQASCTANLKHISELIRDKKYGLNVTCFLGPQHGIRGEKQDNMVESEDFIDPISGLPIYSLYSATRIPTADMMARFDAFLVDLQDIGTRIYTFMYTLANCMRAAKETGKKVIVLDRPNPIGGIKVEGNVLEAGFTSFVGQFPMPTRHGLTMGELALLFNEHYAIGCDLEIIRLKNWRRKMYADQWKRDWVVPSPNIPTWMSALVFPGTVIFEGTNVSEGRGTTHPFEWVGAPFINADRLASELNSQKLPGVYFRPIYFQPTFHKGKDQICGGVQIHVTQRERFDSFLSGTRLLEKIFQLHPRDFTWKNPPYEYEYDRMPPDLIAGTDRLRLELEKNQSTRNFEKESKADLKNFLKIRKDFLLYS